MIVRRVIEKEVECCAECPYYCEVQDMNATLPWCIKLDELHRDDVWAGSLPFNHYDRSTSRIDERCPFLRGE